MSHTTSDARKRAAESDVVSVQIGGTKFVPEGSPPTVPRLARSVDDLRVGMVVAVKPQNSGWENQDSTVREVTVEWWETASYYFHDPGNVVILSDPPARDWLVPATQMEALREALHLDDLWAEGGVNEAARAVLDAAREVEHE